MKTARDVARLLIVVAMDYYPLDDEQWRLVADYSDWVNNQVVAAVGEALGNLKPAALLKGEDPCTFAASGIGNLLV